ncbi:hypothetical protein BDQ17DRAFT_1430453 [Cyathus striatus]|nr:hypothetical protein BDQ17DRAFT_1430453 [Cyathus striatus]
MANPRRCPNDVSSGQLSTPPDSPKLNSYEPFLSSPRPLLTSRLDDRPLQPQKFMTDAPEGSGSTQKRTVYEASVLDGSQHKTVLIEGAIHNSAGSGIHLELFDLLREGKITVDQSIQLHESYSRNQGGERIVAATSKNSSGDTFHVKGSIYNETTIRKRGDASSSGAPVNKT